MNKKVLAFMAFMLVFMTACGLFRPKDIPPNDEAYRMPMEIKPTATPGNPATKMVAFSAGEKLLGWEDVDPIGCENAVSLWKMVTITFSDGQKITIIPESDIRILVSKYNEFGISSGYRRFYPAANIKTTGDPIRIQNCGKSVALFQEVDPISLP